MHAPERHSHILTELSRSASVSIKELTSFLGVSRETIRKDLELLSNQGKLSQVRGGAVRIRNFEPPLEDRLQTNAVGKSTIANLVVEMIPDGASIMIDSGSTALVAAERLAERRKDLVVFTNDVHIALAMSAKAAEVNVFGGRLDVRDGALYGLETIEAVQRYRTDFALIGVAGFDDKATVTDFSRETAALREAMILSSEEAFILADSSKFGKSGRSSMRLDGSVTLVSDQYPGEATRESFGDIGIKFLSPPANL